MKVLIFYDQIASALKTNDILQSIRHNGEVKVDWEINLWHIGIVRFPSVADEALKQGADADVIVFAGCRGNLLRPWTIQWLERWYSTRLNEHAVLALVDGQFTDIRPQINAFELSKFFECNNTSFAACGESKALLTT